MEKPLAIIPIRDHFGRDRSFSDCWDIMQKERQSEARRSFYNEQNGHPDVKIPWKWNNVGIMKEFFHGPTDLEKSCEVDTTKWFHKILLDVQHFTPDDLTITLTNRVITIKGKHEEEGDDLGAVSHQFTRKYTFPSDVVMDGIQCHLSKDEILNILVPRTRKLDEIPANYVNVIPEDAIKHSFPPVKAQNSRTPEDSDDENEECSVHMISANDDVPFWARETSLGSQFGVKSNLEKFKVVIDVSQFAREEVKVYSTQFYINVEGKHEEKHDPHGFIKHHFTRKYWMPGGVKTGDLICNLSKDNNLEITAPMPKHSLEELEKTARLPIVMIEEARVHKWYDPDMY